MASGRGNMGSTYDLARGLRLYEGDGPLPERAAELWRHLAPAELDIARDFWRRYRQSEEVGEPISDDKVEELAKRIVPYLRDKFTAIASARWVDTARSYVEKALANRVSLSTLLAGVAAETDTAFAALRAGVPEGPEVIRLCRTLGDVEMMEIEVFVHHAMEITRAQVDARQANQADIFNQKVMGVVQRCTAESEQLRHQASTTSSAARGMLGDGMTFVGVLGAREGADAYIGDMKRMRLKYDIQKIFTSGDDVCVFSNLKISGVSIFCSSWYHVTEGKVDSLRVVFDPRPVLEQSRKH